MLKSWLKKDARNKAKFMQCKIDKKNHVVVQTVMHLKRNLVANFVNVVYDMKRYYEPDVPFQKSSDDELAM